MEPGHMHWSDMNIPRPQESHLSTCYIGQSPPPDFVLPDSFSCVVYTKDNLMPDITKLAMRYFISQHDRTGSGNITELSEESLNRIMEMPHLIAVLRDQKGDIVGVMVSLILHAKYKSSDVLTTYNTFLCVRHEDRNKGYAMILIRAIMKTGYTFGIMHGYYMVETTHHHNSHVIKSWYRPINTPKAKSAGYTLAAINPAASATAQRLTYHISKPKILPQKCTKYAQFLKILKHGEFHLAPTYQEYQDMIKCFDIYIVDGTALFMLFPMTITIGESGKRMRNAHLALMVGDVLPQVMWICQEQNYDVLYGWCHGSITEENVSLVKGHITVANNMFEVYNTYVDSKIIACDMPIF